jgi:hypothetical protein
MSSIQKGKNIIVYMMYSFKDGVKEDSGIGQILFYLYICGNTRI